MRAVVLGASGVVGSALVPVLAEQCEVVAVSRSGRTPPADHVEPTKADVTDAEAMGRVLQGADVVYYLVHSLGAADFSAVDRRRGRDGRPRRGRPPARQIVYLGGLGDDQPDLSEHLRSRIETAEALASGPGAGHDAPGGGRGRPRQRRLRDHRRPDRPAAGDGRAALDLDADPADRPR